MQHSGELKNYSCAEQAEVIASTTHDTCRHCGGKIKAHIQLFFVVDLCAYVGTA